MEVEEGNLEKITTTGKIKQGKQQQPQNNLKGSATTRPNKIKKKNLLVFYVTHHPCQIVVMV